MVHLAVAPDLHEIFCPGQCGGRSCKAIKSSLSVEASCGPR